MTASLRRLRRVRTRAIPTYLVVAQSSELDDVRLTLATLPICAHGRVIIVAEPGETVEALELPARMSVTVRVRRAGQEAALAARQSVHAWASEMVCGDEQDAEDSVAPGLVAWVAGRNETFVSELSNLLGEEHGLSDSSIRRGSLLGSHD